MSNDLVKSEEPVRYKTGRETSNKWYVIPPTYYTNYVELWLIVKYINDAQELVAKFEDRQECEDTVQLHNDNL